MSSAAAASGADVMRSFQCVYIPADKSKSVEEWTIKYNTASEVSCLMERLKAHFVSGGMSDVDRNALRANVREQIKATLAKQNPEAANKPVDDGMIDMILQMSAVDCVPLQNNKKSTNYIGLQMYVDDQGKAKGLAVNERATRVTMECGTPTQVLGDTVIARNYDDENNFKRMDFTLEEYFKAKEWRLDAAKANAEKSGNAEQTAKLQALMSQTQQNGNIVNLLDAASARQAAAATAAPAVKTCANPACEQDAHMRCGRCKRSSYCSVACQKKDFKFHKANVCIAKEAVEAKTTTNEATTPDAAAAPAATDAAAAPAAEAK